MVTHRQLPILRPHLMCPHCDIGMTYHRGDAKMRCHYCDYEAELPTSCPACGEKVYRVKALAPSNSNPSSNPPYLDCGLSELMPIRWGKKHAHGDLLAQFAAGEADCLVGTQMVAKGLISPG